MNIFDFLSGTYEKPKLKQTQLPPKTHKYEKKRNVTKTNSDALRFVYGRYRQPTSVPGISLYETTNENDKGGDPGDSDESDRYGIRI